MQRRGASGQPVKGRPKVRKAPTAHVSPDHSAEQFDRLKRERDEALEQLTATSEVLRVIRRSPNDVQPVFDMIAESAAKLCAAQFCFVYRFDGQFLHFVAHHSVTPEMIEINRRTYPQPPSRGSVAARSILEKSVVQIPDVNADPNYTLGALAAAGGYRTAIGIPILHDGLPIGAIAVTRAQAGSFPNRQIELLKTFAEQAVIAIENTRLFNETKEALEQQTATSEVLQTISRSLGDLQPVFETMLENAVRICDAKFGKIRRWDGEVLHLVATHNAPSAFADARRHSQLRPTSGTPIGRMVATKTVIHVADLAADPGYIEERSPSIVAAVELEGVRTILYVPMLKETELIGAFTLSRQEVRPFTNKQIELVTNFAAQAVIAIENARLFNELRESLQQQTATADVLKVIAGSSGDLEPVFQAMLKNAARLCDADKTIITREKNGALYRAEAYGFSREFMDHVSGSEIKVERGSAFGRALLEGRVIHIPDVKADPEYTFVEHQKLGDYRTVLAVPMLREGVPSGVLNLSRSQVRPFTDKQIELATTFADQAAIAIENVRLFESVEARTRELGKSLEDLRSTQDRLVQTQKLASLGQLTAGIAHEIKNPLNFVNNFSGISAELIDELQDTLKDISLDDKARTEINELTDTLKSNFDKVVHHGRRADAIVKNMLQHSREGSGEHRVIDINALVEESLNLAWHGARAETQGFEIKLKQSFDPSAGGADIFPQDIRRALLNLIANGFYAATKRRAETNGGDYEPTLTASTKNLGDRVEIRIRDNGTGMTPDVKEKMFEPFFTTKPTGEGTGLGLSISHDIIVKQ